MRKNKRNFYIYHIVDAVAGTIYRMAPRNRPRNMDKIMSHVIENAEQACVDVVNNRHLFMTHTEFSDWLTDMLKSCPDFCNLNLSQNEVDSGVSVDDESRPKYAFTSVYNVETEDSWKNDFIDLDAAIRNIYDCIIAAHEETDCFLCDHKETEMCHYCILHYKNSEDYKNLYEYANKPHDTSKYGGWCAASCPKGVAVCCQDCTEFDRCNLEDKCTNPGGYDCPSFVIKHITNTSG